MQQRGSFLLVGLAGIVAASMPLSGFHSLAAGDEDAILRAYMEDRDIAAEIQEYRSRGYRDEGARAMLTSGICGVVGCQCEFHIGK